MKISNCAAMTLTFLLLVPGLDPQIMPFQPGRVNVYSEPSGALVYMNGQKMQQPTNATFVVTPGNYQISVDGSQLNPSVSCPVKKVRVDPGQTVTLHCPKPW